MDEPGAGVSPVILGSALGEAQSSGGFNVGHAHETTQFDHLCLNGVDGGELVERLVYGEELIVVTTRPGHFNTFKVHPLLVSTVPLGAFAAGLFNENAAHGLGGGAEEMSPAREVWIRVAHQPQPGFMHQRGGLQSLVGAFIRHARRRQLAQLLIDQRKQFIGGLRVAVLDGLQNAGNVAQPATVIKLPSVVPVNLASVLQTKKSRRQFHCWRRKDCPVQLKNHGPVVMFHRTMG